MFLVTAGEMQEMDRRTIESFGIPGRLLMESAGRGATDFLLHQFEGLKGKRAGIIAGRGNNGGDGFVIARCLEHKGINVTVYLLTQKSRVTGDAAANLELLSSLNVPVIEMSDESSFMQNKTSMIHQDLWVDAILGTGLKSDVKGYFKKIIEFINESDRPVFSVDIPSGLNSDTGQPCGVSVRADATATFAFAKTGHILFPGAEYTGKLKIVDIGIPPHIAKEVNPAQHLLTSSFIAENMKQRPLEAHKGLTGHLLVIAGSTGKTGAAAMVSIAAMRSGAGLVTLGIPACLNSMLETMTLEAMTLPLPGNSTGKLDETSFQAVMEVLPGKKCLAIGPGIGTEEGTKKLVLNIIKKSPVPMVIDADGLNNLAGDTDILKDIKAPVILTPHPGEMAKLLNTTPAEVQKNRISAARDFALRFKVHLVLKGAKTIIAHPDGNIYINPTGNPGMASGGMGDALTGIIAGLITQGYDITTAAHAGVYIHGAAADYLKKIKGPVGFLAGELIDQVPYRIKELLDEKAGLR